MTGVKEKEKIWLVKLEKQFQVIAGDDNIIDLDEFKSALNVKKSFFAERFFELIDTDQSGSISLKELIGALRLLVNGTEKEKLHFLFQVYDADGSGFIDFDELKTVLHSCTAESALTLSDETLTELTEILFEDADADGDGQVSFEELSEQLQRYPSITANLTLSGGCAAEWLNPRTKKPKRQSPTSTCCSYQYLRNHLSFIIFWVVYVMINAGLAAWGAYEGYQSISDERHPAALSIARSSGRCLSFNCCFVLVLMLRKLLTILRNTFLMSVLPLDQHVTIHKVVGVLIILLTFIHVIGHLTNIGLSYQVEMVNGTTLTWVLEVLVRPFPGLGLVEGSCIITGLLIIIVLIIMTICSLPFIRRNGYFKVFYWTHQLCIIFWILIIIHSKYFWIWFIVPGTIYIAERVLRLQTYRRARFGVNHIHRGYVLPSNVVHLVIQRPTKFKFQAGEYIYVNIPSIAPHEWHPFTISSAPEQREFLSLHIRSVGHWTKRLYGVFKEREGLTYLTDSPNQGMIDNDDITTNLNHTEAFGVHLGKPLDVIVEVCSAKSTPSASPSQQRDYCTSNGSLRETRQRSSTKIRERKRIANGEANLGFEQDLPDEVNDPTKTPTNDNPCNNNRNDGGSFEQKMNPAHVELPRYADSPSPTVLSSRVDGSLVPAIELGHISKTAHGNGNSFKPKPLSSREGIDVQDEPQGDTTEIPSMKKVKRFDSSLNRGRITGQPNGGSRRTTSVLAVRRNSALHPLELSKILATVSHTGMEVIVDGPYGAPAQHIMEAEHAVLIGAGIGITPFASILQSLHEKYKAAKKHCPNCHHAWMTDTSSILKSKKVDFFWINRQQRSFEWFISLLNAIEIEQAEMPAADRFLDIHLYMTSALSPSDMKAIGLHVALDLIHKKNNRDTITGLTTRTQHGRPNWDEVFQNLKLQQKGKITVFFCGSPALGKIIRTKCLQYQVGFRKENF